MINEGLSKEDVVKGAEQAPLTIDKLLEKISKANNNADVKFKGYKEFSQVELACMSKEELEKLQAGTGLRISKEFQQSAKNHSKRKIKKIVEYYDISTKRVLIAIGDDNTVWLYNEYGWNEMKEPTIPDLPERR